MRSYVLATVCILILKPALRVDAYNPTDVPAIAFVVAELRKFILAILAGALIVRLESFRLDTWNPFAVLGRASYSLYALHTPIAFYLFEMGASWHRVIVNNIAVALVSNLLIERPGMALGKHSFLKLSASVSMFMGFMAAMPGGPQMRQSLVLPANTLGLRWVAD